MDSDPILKNKDLPENRTIKILLSMESRLLRELAHRALAKVPQIQIVGECSERQEIMSILETEDVHWILISTGESEGSLLESLLFANWNPAVSLVGIARDGSFIKIRRIEIQDEMIPNPSLNELVTALLSNVTGRRLNPASKKGKI